MYKLLEKLPRKMAFLTTTTTTSAPLLHTQEDVIDVDDRSMIPVQAIATSIRPKSAERNWYCFMVIKRPKIPGDTNNNNGTIADVHIGDIGLEDSFEYINAANLTDRNSNTTGSVHVKDFSHSLKESDEEGGGGEEDDSDEEEAERKKRSKKLGGKEKTETVTMKNTTISEPLETSNNNNNNAVIIPAKPKKRRKQDRRTSLHVDQDPFGFVRKLNKDPPLPAGQSLSETLFGQPSVPSSRTSPMSATKPLGYRSPLGSASGSPIIQQVIKNGEGGGGGGGAITTIIPDQDLVANTATPLRRKRKSFSYQIVSIIGPCSRREEAVMIETVWNFRSRAVAPRMVFASVIAERFKIKSWHDIQCMFHIKYFHLVQVGDTIYLRLNRAHKLTTTEMRQEVENLLQKNLLKNN